jgi:hypothetical protein
VNVAEKSFRCTDARLPAPASGVRADKNLGRQDIYVRLASSGTQYDAGTSILSSNVTVQNLLRQAMGTEDGSTLKPIRVFFSTVPTVTSGTGSVSIQNADGTDVFTESNQPYFQYAQILSPYEISNARNWQFNVDPTVVSFTFTVFVSAPLADYAGPLLDHVWTGAVDSVWSTGGNWNVGVAPDSASTVAIPADSLLASHRYPVLDSATAISNLRVGQGSSLNLGGFTLTAYGNVDGTGTVSNGLLHLAGPDAIVNGRLSSVQVTGSTRLQGSTVTSGAMSVSGVLTVKDQALSISIP